MDSIQFATYLKQGHGRPYLHFQQHDAARYTEALLHTCLYNPTYDRQCEGSRADYLHELTQLTSEPHWFQQRVLDALADPNDAMDLEQLCDFALIYARGGDARARRMLYERVAQQTLFGEYTGAYQIIALDGIEGLLFVADQRGQVLQSDPTLWDDDHFLRYLASTGVETNIEQLCTMAGDTYPFAVTYLKHATAHAQRKTIAPRPQLQGLPYKQINDHITHTDIRFAFLELRRWGESAPDDELQQAARDLLQQTDQHRLSAYFAIFEKRAFPLDVDLLMRFVWHHNKRIALRAIQAISQVQHPAVREFAFTLIEAKHYASNALDILIKNYQLGDDLYLATLIAQTTDVDELHGVGLRVNDIFAAHPTLAAAGIFLDLYERGPCSLCRRDFVRRLIEIDCVPAWMADEGLHDANEETREELKAYLHV